MVICKRETALIIIPTGVLYVQTARERGDKIDWLPNGI
jgi:hypothetical protein